MCELLQQLCASFGERIHRREKGARCGGSWRKAKCDVNSFGIRFLLDDFVGLAMCRHLVWEDGHCGHASCPAGSEASEVGCESGGTVCTLVRKVMASQVHVVGDG